MLRRVLVALLLAWLCCITTGCGVAYTVKRNNLLKNATAADYGPPPPANYTDTEKQMILRMLKDPDSAQYRDEIPPFRDIIQKVMNPNPFLVWVTQVSVNARTSAGGFAGFSAWMFAWQNGRVVAISSPPVGDYRTWDFLE